MQNDHGKPSRQSGIRNRHVRTNKSRAESEKNVRSACQRDSNPSRRRTHPSQKGGRTVRQTAYRRRIGDPVCVLRHSVVQLERKAGRRFQYPRTAFLHFRIVVGGGRFDLPCPAADDLRLRAVLVDDDCRPFVVRLFLPANGLHRNYAVDRQPGRRR
nr:Uncharacterised protein [Neisseria gonorrhoeae]